MTIVERLLAQRRLVLAAVALLSLSGALAWFTMIRQEDPRMPEFWGQIVTVYPGADAATVERMVLDPLEDALVQVNQIKELNSTAYDGVATVMIKMRDDVQDFPRAWDDVREAIDVARVKFPDGVREPQLNDKMQDPESIVLGLTGDPDPLKLLDAARRLRDDLLSLRDVARVDIVAHPHEQAVVEMDDATAHRLGLTPSAVAAQLAGRNQVVPGGSLAVGGMSARLHPLSEFESVDEIARTPVAVPGGAMVPLDQLARVRLGPEEPVSALMRVNGEPAVGLAVVARSKLNLVTYGREVRARVAQLAPRLAPVKIHEVAFQPERVESRLGDLGRSLLMSMLVVAGVLVLTMGVRLGLVVTTVLPLVAFSALAVFALGGGVLHQISIAALVLSMGMLVDNAVVVAEGIQWRLDQGQSASAAALATVRELAVPLAGATGTTLSAFVPMLIAQGPTAVFTRTLPVVIMLTLSVSYLFAVFFTPIVAGWGLVPGSARGSAQSQRVADRLASLAVGRSRWVLAAAVALVLGSVFASQWVRQQFFPSSDRNQLVVDLKLPEGAHLSATSAAARKVERALLARDEVTDVAAFIGRGAPRFYYNIIPVPYSPHFAQLVVGTRTREDVDTVIETMRAFAHDDLPGAEIVARRLEQGPPVGAPVEVRLYGTSLKDLYGGAQQVARQVHEIEGTADVRQDLGPGSPTLDFRVDDAAAARVGISRADVAQAIYGRTRGLPIGQLHSGEDPIPVVVRSSLGERLPVDDLMGIGVAGRGGPAVPLSQVASIEPSWRPAAIRHRNARRVVTVSAQLSGDTTFSQVLTALTPHLRALALPAGVTWSYGGEAEGSGEANTAMMRVLPIGVLLLLVCLLMEFNSFRRVAIILVTIPLAAAGVVPGLLLGRQPFGFMSLLGVIALVGIVVNNAILLLEVVEARRAEGASIDEALTDAIHRRLRPIFLTSLTTIAGLLPMAFSRSTFWPPLAWAVISGLAASTMLTLVVIPALYREVFKSHPWLRWRGVAVLPLLVLVLIPARAHAQQPQQITLGEAISLAASRPAADAASQVAASAASQAAAEQRAAFLPVVGGEYSLSDRNRDLALETPIGEFPFGASRVNAVGVEIRQPLLDPSRMFFAAPAARAEARAARQTAQRSRHELAAQAALAHLKVLALEARTAATAKYVESLEGRHDEVDRMVEAGRALEADALKIELALEQARQDLVATRQEESVARLSLAQAVGMEGAVDPAPAPDWRSVAPPTLGEATARAMETRADLAALTTTQEALAKRQTAVKAEALPRLEGRVAWTWSDGTPYTVDNWAEGSVHLTWTPFMGGSRLARSAALGAQRRALRARRAEAGRSVALEVRQALAWIETARTAVGVGERGVEQAGEALRVERERHAEGRATTNDLLAAEAALREQETRWALARLDVVRGWITLWLAGGADLPFQAAVPGS